LGRILVVGHKGAGLSEPENTLRSIRRAIEIGVDAVEVDVRRTRDRHLVLIHDATVDRTTDGKGMVDSFLLDELRALDAGQGEKIPTLEEAIGLVDGRVGLVIEIKEPDTISQILETVGALGNAPRTTFASAWHESLKTAKERYPSSMCEVLLGCEPVNPAMPAVLALEAKADVVFMGRQFLSEMIVSEAHARSIRVGAGSVNSANDLSQVLKLGVDEVGSDAPELVIGALGQNRYRASEAA
jgi:glycerophosphoryl diester phosphodiesterase